MTIPKKVKIGGHIYNVRVEKDLLDWHAALGKSAVSDTEIKIADTLAQSQKEETLLHEITHVLLTEIEEQIPKEMRETLVTVFGNRLHQVIVDNPNIFCVKEVKKWAKRKTKKK